MKNDIDKTIIRSELMLRSGDGSSQLFISGETRVGREQDCEIRLNDKSISRYHARIRLTDRGIVIEDLQSTNGTYVNGRRINKPRIIRMGDELRFHRSVFRLVSDQATDAEATIFGNPMPAHKIVTERAANESANNSAAQSLPVDPGMSLAEAAAAAEPPAILAAAEESQKQEPRRRANKRPNAIERENGRYRARIGEYLERAGQLPEGSWIECSAPNSDAYMCCKLVARQASKMQFYFLNARGMGVVTLDRKELATAMLLNRVRVLDQGPLFGRLMTRLVELIGHADASRGAPLYTS